MDMAPSPREDAIVPSAVTVGHVTSTDIGLMFIRLVVGAVFLYHGSQKLFGMFDGPGLDGFAQYLGQLRIPMANIAALVSGAVEFVGGLLVLLGLFVRIATIPMVINMLVAVLVVHRGAFAVSKGGMEYALTMALVLLGLFFTGPGAVSVSGMLRGRSASAASDVHR